MPTRLLALLLFAVAALPGCDLGGGEPDDADTDLVAYFGSKQRFEPLAEVLTVSGLDATIRTGGALTVLAPTAVAFESVGSDFLAVLREPRNAATLRRVLQTHLIPGLLRPEDFVDGATLTSIDGTDLAVRRIGDVVLVDGVRLDLEPIERGDHVAYAVADVLLRGIPTADRIRLSPSLTQLVAAAEPTGALALASTPVTVLAPLNDAFVALGETANRLRLTSTVDIRRRVFRSHIVPGLPPIADGAVWTSLDGDPLRVVVNGGVRTVGGRRIIREENTADGRILVLDGVIFEPLTIEERIRIEDPFDEFRGRAERDTPALWNRLDAEGQSPLTVFAPNDFAYSLQIPDVTSILAEPASAALRTRLVEVHVVEGRWMPDDLEDGQTLTTVRGETLFVTRVGSVIQIDGRTVGAPRIASNGVLYDLQGILAPRVDALDTALLRGFTQHVRAVRLAGLDALFRTDGLTAFIGPNELYFRDPSLFTSPARLAALLRFNATLETIPTIPSSGRVSFTAIDGSVRSVGLYVPVTDPCTPKPETPCPPEIPPYLGLEDGKMVVQGFPALDGSGVIHFFPTDSTFSEPPTSSARARGRAR